MRSSTYIEYYFLSLIQLSKIKAKKMVKNALFFFFFLKPQLTRTRACSSWPSCSSSITSDSAWEHLTLWMFFRISILEIARFVSIFNFAVLEFLPRRASSFFPIFSRYSFGSSSEEKLGEVLLFLCTEKSTSYGSFIYFLVGFWFFDCVLEGEKWRGLSKFDNLR